jgi:PhnB protein
MLYVKDVDAFFERAVAAGATAVMAPADQFWGDRYAQIEDPYGHVWALATHLRDMTAREMKQAMSSMEAARA